jgi:aconitate decarboxylase
VVAVAATPEKGRESPTAALADFATSLRFDELPAATVAHAKLSILDTVGCAVFGATLPWIEMLRQFVQAEEGAEQATLWGSATKVTRTQAALVNGTAAHAFELDDIHMGGMIHPGALSLGASLAIGEPAGISGQDLLTAFVAGCEVGARVGLSVGIMHFRAGYHPQGTVGVFAAAAAAARAMGLDRKAGLETIGLAGTQAAGLMAAQEGSMAKRLHSGLAAQNGVRSALLAQQGFTGIANVLEADFGGFLGTMGGGSVQPALLTDGLGSRWETDQIGFKPYASCAAAQSSIDVARLIRESAHLSAEQVESVTIHTSTHAQLHCGWEYEPTGVTAAQMSIPYGVASMLTYGDVSANRFTEQAIAEPDTVALARRVSVLPDEAIDALGPDLRYTIRFELRTKEGEVLTGEAADRPGGPTRPLSDDAVRAKFFGLTGPLLGARRARDLHDAVDRLDELTDVGALVSLLTPAGAPR